MSEMALTADHLIVIGRGRLIADAGITEFIDAGSTDRMLVRSRNDEALSARLVAAGMSVEPVAPSGLLVSGPGSSDVGEIALAARIVLDELTPQKASLEQAFMDLTRDSVDFVARPTGDHAPAPGAAPVLLATTEGGSR